MLTALTYNCNPESLDEITPGAFVDAFENEIVAKPQYRDTKVTVTFQAGRSRLTSITSDDQDDAEDYGEICTPALQDEFHHYAEKAFWACCES